MFIMPNHIHGIINMLRKTQVIRNNADSVSSPEGT